jgi:hypothetical protein
VNSVPTNCRSRSHDDNDSKPTNSDLLLITHDFGSYLRFIFSFFSFFPFAWHFVFGGDYPIDCSSARLLFLLMSVYYSHYPSR